MTKGMKNDSALSDKHIKMIQKSKDLCKLMKAFRSVISVLRINICKAYRVSRPKIEVVILEIYKLDKHILFLKFIKSFFFCIKDMIFLQFSPNNFLMYLTQKLKEFVFRTKLKKFRTKTIKLAFITYLLLHRHLKNSRVSQKQSEVKAEIEGHKRSVFGKRGLINLGNTCFMNSALQCLHKTHEIEQRCRLLDLESETPLSWAYLQLCDQFAKTGQNTPLSPNQIRQIIIEFDPTFEGYWQQDACEWISSFLSKLNQQTNSVKKIEIHKISDSLRRSQDQHNLALLFEQSIIKSQKRSMSIVDSTIYGYHRTMLKCLKCQQQAQSLGVQSKGLYILFQKFHAIYLPIPSKKSPTLSDCFQQFCQPERLVNTCDVCQTQQPSEKTLSLYYTNQILVLCLKRFGKKKKINTPVKIPLHLDSQFMRKFGNRQNEIRYSLYAMINHSGTLNGGHYTAICHDTTNQWVMYNDSHCRNIETKEVMQMARSAYVLFYRKNRQ